MYCAFGQLMAEFKLAVRNCLRMPLEYYAMLSKIRVHNCSLMQSRILLFAFADEWVLRAFLILDRGFLSCGFRSENSPNAVYFFEERLPPTPFIKYCSNNDFINRQPNDKLHQLMHALVHWSFEISGGSRLVCDLQGTGDFLIDIQFLDNR